MSRLNLDYEIAPKKALCQNLSYISQKKNENPPAIKHCNEESPRNGWFAIAIAMKINKKYQQISNIAMTINKKKVGLPLPCLIDYEMVYSCHLRPASENTGETFFLPTKI